MKGNFRNYVSAYQINCALEEARRYAQRSYLERWREVEDLAHRKCAWLKRNRTVEREAHYRENNTKCIMMDYQNAQRRETAMLILDTLERMSESVPDNHVHHRTIRLLNCEWEFIYPFLPSQQEMDSALKTLEAKC